MGLKMEWMGRGIEVRWTDQRFSLVVPPEQVPAVVAHYYNLSTHTEAACPVCQHIAVHPRKKGGG